MQVTTEELQLIREQGAPANPGPELATIDPDGVLTFTPRGRQIYRLAMLLHGLSPEPVEAVRTHADLIELSRKVDRMRAIYAKDEESRRASGGRVPAKARAIAHAASYGTPEELHAAIEQRLACEEAGENVIPGLFRPRAAGSRQG